MSYKKSIILALYVEPVTATDKGFGNWVEHQLYATLGGKPNIIAPAMAVPPQMTAEFWADTTKILGTIIVALQYQWPHQQYLGSTHSGQTNRIEKYDDCVLADLVGYSNVFNTSDIPRIWGKFQKSKELVDIRQELNKGV